MSKTYDRLQSAGRATAPPPPAGPGSVSPAEEEAVRGSRRKNRAYLVILIVAAVTVGLAVAVPYILPSSSGMRVIPRNERSRDRRDRGPRRREKPEIIEARVPEGSVKPGTTPRATASKPSARPAADSAPKSLASEAFLVTPEILSDSAAGESLAVATAKPGEKASAQETVAVNIGKGDGEAPVRRTRPEATAEGAPETRPRKFITNFKRAVSLQEAGQLDEAVTYYNKVLLETPGHPATLCNMGIIYQDLKKFDRAIEYFSKAIAADPGNYHAYSNLGGCHILQGRYDRAVVALRKGLKLSPDNYSSLCNMGVALTGLRTFDMGERVLMRAIALAPGRVRAFYNLGNLYRMDEQPRKAIHFYRLFLEKARGRYPRWERIAKRHINRLERMQRLGAKQ